MAVATALLFSNVHRQEQPPIAQRAFMSGPFVQHGDLETHPAQIFGQVFASVGVAVQADDQLIAVDAFGTCKLEEGGEAAKNVVLVRVLVLFIENNAYPGFKSCCITSRSKKTKRARETPCSATKLRKRTPLEW
jgi:hypothetical protein